MQFGVCGDPALGLIAQQAGYDYFEWSVGGLLNPREPDDVFRKALAQAQAVGIPCPALNVFIPADLKITGPKADLEALEAYVTIVFQRAQQAGVEVIVFGSGGARQIPDGYDRGRAWRQLIAFGQMLAPIAQLHSVTVVVEPLNTGETNVINTVAEGAALVEAVDHPGLRLLVDGYHWTKDNDSRASILQNIGLIHHAHIAAVAGRLPPHPGDDCAAFLAVLREAGYTRRLSIEGNINDPTQDLRQALAILKTLATV